MLHVIEGPGIKIPTVGFGTYLIKNDEAASIVQSAIQIGYRHIDTAEVYRNEKGVGLGIQASIAAGIITREELFVTTKLWPGNRQWKQTPKNYETTIQTLNESLERLQLEYVDLYLIHAPFPKAERLEQWRALMDLREEGKVTSIGVSNFNHTHIEEIKKAGLAIPDANQIEVHPWSQKPDLVAYLSDNRIVTIAYSSLVPLSTWRATGKQRSAKTDQMKADGSRPDSPFKVMATKYGVSEAQILLKWAVQKGYAVLPKSTNPDRIRQNFDLFSFQIDLADMALIGAMDRGEGVAWSTGDPLNTD